MPDMIDAVRWIWFQLMFGIGSSRSHALLEYFETPGEILAGIERRSRVLSMLREEELTAWEKTLTLATELYHRTLRKGVDVVTPEHPDYPPLLGNIYAKPAVLYVKGDLGCLRDTLVVAIVGTRAFTDYGRDAAELLADGLARSGAVVVSGLAKGIDTVAHTAALDAGGKSVGILGCGIDVDYPKGSAGLKRRMCENGAVVTEYPLGAEVRPANFPMRNRLISGMSDGTVVVEADLKSGSIITATHAAEQGREIFSVPGSIFSFREQGTHKLIKEGAKLTESAEDILEEFSGREFPGLKPAGKPRRNEKLYEETVQLALDPEPHTKTAERAELPPGLSGAARAVYGLIGPEPAGFDRIAAGCPLATGDIQSALTELEIYGLIRGYPGRRFSL